MLYRPHHTAISVKNLKNTLEFYEKLGFKQVHRYDDPDKIGIKLKLGDYFLEIFAYHKNQAADPLEQTLGGNLDQVGIKHFALTVDDIETALEDLKAKSLANENTEILSKGEARFFFVQDPDGIWVEIIDERRF